MAFISLIRYGKTSDAEQSAWDSLEFHQEAIGGGEYTLTVVGDHADIVVYLARRIEPDSDTGLNWLINQIQLEDSSMDEHNVAASAVGL